MSETIELWLRPEIEEALVAEADQRGVSVDDVINEILEEKLPAKIEGLINATLDAILAKRGGGR